MKKSQILLLALAFPLASFAQRSNYQVRVTGLTPSAVAYLIPADQPKLKALPENGIAEFKGEIPNPGLATLLILPDPTTSPQDGESFYVYIVKGQTDISVEGSKINVTANDYSKDFNDLLLNPVMAFNKKVNDLKLANMGKNDPEIQKKILAAVEECFNVPKTYIKKHPNSPVSIQALTMMNDGTEGYPVKVPELETLFNSLNPEVKDSENGKQYMGNLLKWKTRDQQKANAPKKS